MTVSNVAPTVSGVSLNAAANITLTEDTTTSVNVIATLTDTNGGADISSATATIYRSSVSGVANCTADDNQCYQVASGSCTLGSASGNDKPATCTAGIWFVADATDSAAPTFAADIWSAGVGATDAAGLKGFATNSAQSIEVNSLTALNVSASIAYGSLAPTSTSASSQTATVTTTGNRMIDVQFQAVNDMCDTTNCVGGNEITADRQQFATGSNIAWSDPVLLGATKLASTSAQTLNLTTTKPTTHVGNTSDTAQDTFWRIGIPSGQALSTYNGTTTATAVNGA
ncbi:MAG: hypothetical protein HY006_01420 [Candidatus Sungbacteria bacterium]|nr:hypothetical protein [Candidatus Sungbacteria bacterium]